MEARFEAILSVPENRAKVARAVGLSDDATADEIEEYVATRDWTLEQIMFERDPEAPHPTPFADPPK